MPDDFQHESKNDRLSIACSSQAKRDLQELSELTGDSISSLLEDCIQEKRKQMRRIRARYGGEE